MKFSGQRGRLEAPEPVRRGAVGPYGRYRLRDPDGLVDAWVRQRLCPREEALLVRRRVMAGEAAHGHVPPVVFYRQDQAGPRVVRGPAVYDDPLPVGGLLVEARCVTDAGLDALLRRRSVAELLEPARGPGVAPAGVHHQVGAQEPGLLPPAPAPDVDAHDPAAVPGGDEPNNVMLCQELDAPVPGEPAANVPLQQEPAGERPLAGPPFERLQGQPAGRRDDRQVLPAGRRGTVGAQVRVYARKETPDDPLPPGQDPMRVPGLRHPPAMVGRRREPVPVNHGHPLEMVRQNPRRQKPRHAAPDDHRATAPGNLPYPLFPLLHPVSLRPSRQRPPLSTVPTPEPSPDPPCHLLHN